jgi:endonuclease YncB( thermonuclease family)
LLLTVVATGAIAATTLHGRVVHVVDGGELILLVGGNRVNVRLAHLEAPEQGQRYSIASRQSLSAICGGELATAEVSGKDGRRRMHAHVSCAGIDAGAEQVRRGMARVSDNQGERHSPLHLLERDAQAARRGLWAQSPRTR